MREWPLRHKGNIRAKTARLTNPLCKPPQLHIEYLRGGALALSWINKPQFSREVAVTEDGSRHKINAVTLDAGMNFREGPHGRIALALAQGLFVALTAALFVVWLASSR